MDILLLNIVKSPTTSAFNVVGQLISIILVLAFTIALIYFFAYIAKKLRLGSGVMQSNNITVLEYKNIGNNNNLILLKVGDKHMLISSNKDRVNFISDINGDSLELQPANSTLQGINATKFKDIFESKFKNENKQNDENAQDSHDDKNGGI